MARIQQHREIAIGTPLGEDVLLIKSMSVAEQLGRPFQYDIKLISEKLDIKAADIVGQNVTIRLNLKDGQIRYFNGFVSRFVHTPNLGDQAPYEATVVPWLWFLTRTADCRIFQDMTAPDIIKQVFRDHGFTDFDDRRLTGNYRKWEYCVQYRETDFNFVSRLMEQEGIYYFFIHENGKHTLIMADSLSAHEAFPGYEEIKYRLHAEENDKEVITQWLTETHLQPGSYALDDFDFKNSQKDLMARAAIPREHSVSEMEIFDYPGEYIETSDGDNYAKIRIEELQAQYEIASAVSGAMGICTGFLFDLAECTRDDQNRKYLVASATHIMDVGGFESGYEGGELTYSCTFRAIDSAQPYRSLRTTPKPSIAGPQTAMVVGPSGEEIYTDEFGRVKVQFHWDRYGKADENSSCWIRVAQVWAGKKWGAMYIPRIGQEVIVEFLEGDPDQPIITGRVYNGQAMPPYDLPAEKTISTLKSNSSKGGQGFNEIRFEDKKGIEQIFIHAEHDHDIRVENDSREWIGSNRHLIVSADHLEQVDGDKHLTVRGDQNESVSGSVSLDAGMDLQQKVGMNSALEAGTEIHLKGGMKVIVEAGMQISLKASGSFIDIGPAGITIQGTMVKVNSGGAAGSGSGCSPDAAKLPDEADNAQPGEVTEPPTPTDFSPAAQVLMNATVSGTPFCEKCEAARAAQKG